MRVRCGRSEETDASGADESVERKVSPVEPATGPDRLRKSCHCPSRTQRVNQHRLAWKDCGHSLYALPMGTDPGQGDGGIASGASTRRERVIRGLFAVGGAVGVALLALIVNVSSPFIIDMLRDGPPVADRVGCDVGVPPNVVGEVRLGIYLSEPGANCWQTALDGVVPGGVFDALVEMRNFTGEQVDDLTVQVQLPAGVNLVAGSTTWGNARNPDGLDAGDGIVSDGLNFGSYGNGANVWAIFTLRLDEGIQVPCGLSSSPVYARLPFQSGQEANWEGAALVVKRHCRNGG
jgi:hypothetical protein